MAATGHTATAVTERSDPPPPKRPTPDADRGALDPQFDVTTARLLRREALRRAAEELNTTSGPGLEDALKRISDEVTADAVERHTAEAAATHPAAPPRRPATRQ